jgi:hypothetical protein
MLTKTKIALAAVLLAGTASFAAAQGFDPNLANRYPAYAEPTVTAQQVKVVQHRTLQSAPVSLNQGRAAVVQPQNPAADQVQQAFHGQFDQGSFDRAAGGTAF